MKTVRPDDTRWYFSGLELAGIRAGAKVARYHIPGSAVGKLTTPAKDYFPRLGTMDLEQEEWLAISSDGSFLSMSARMARSDILRESRT